MLIQCDYKVMLFRLVSCRFAIFLQNSLQKFALIRFFVYLCTEILTEDAIYFLYN
jgi:hypothetical protein